jgi:hypothetical protein
MGGHKEFFLNPNILKKIEYYYKHKPHAVFDNKFTPYQVQNDKELETWFVRKQDTKLINVLKLQRKNRFFEYKSENIILIHKPKGKSKNIFQKRRRNFDEAAFFLEYVNGNVSCGLLRYHMELILPNSLYKISM